MGADKHHVLGIRELCPGTYILRLERRDVQFEPGQYIHVGPLPGINRREYSVYSSPEENYLEILVKEIPEGYVSPRLKKLKPDDLTEVEGPFGFFRLEESDSHHLFIATGTGISPFHCMVQANPGLNYTLVHGVRNAEEFYEHQHYRRENLIRCTSRQDTGDFHGRVTGWLQENPANPSSFVYICGGCSMIYEVYDILGEQGIPSDRIHAEVYF